MDPELLELINRLHNTDNPLTDEELAYIDEQIVAICSDVDPATATDDDLAVLTEAHEASLAVRQVMTDRATAAAERAQRAAELLAEIVPPTLEQEEPEAEEEPEVEAEAPEPPATEPPPATIASENEPVKAAGEVPGTAIQPAPPPRLPTIGRLAARSPRNDPRSQHYSGPSRAAASGRASSPTLIASADLPGVPAGAEVQPRMWAQKCMQRYDALRRVQTDTSDGEKVYWGSIKVQYPEERTFYEGDDEFSNETKIHGVNSRSALVASGGVCAPVAVDYSVTTIAQAGRPMRDAGALATFGASRGGVRYILPHTLAATTADGPSIVWTNANDIALNNPATKPHATFACQPVQEAYVDAVTAIVQFGNFQARYFPEQIDQYMSTVDAVHSRLAESTLLDAIRAGSTAVTAGANALSATRDVLAEVDRAAAALRYRHRMDPDSPLRLCYPEWLEDMFRADLARQLPGDSGAGIERLATTDATIATFFANRNINVTKFQDNPAAMTGGPTNTSPTSGALQGFGIQGVGMLLPWPTIVQMYLFPEGSWLFLDGGELNLGMVRDSVLNRTNDFQMFSESFEKVIFRGHESLSITCDVCPSGRTSATADMSALCLYGS